jgi:hypothetical protein
MFGRKKKQREKLLAETQAPQLALMTEEDHELLTSTACEIRDSLVTFEGEPLLDDAEAVNVATIPVTVLEIEYPDRLVTLHMEFHHYPPEG